jgi:lipoyl(octanoyl) transferase
MDGAGQVVVRSFLEKGYQPYESTMARMREFTRNRDESTTDEIWLLEHDRVFTLGQAGKREHLIDPRDIPVVQSDRGGQVTYHGPGQLIAYLLLDIRRLGIGVREFVVRIENAIVGLLDECGVEASGKREAPGVYVDDRKIAALGLRVRKGRSYHGLSLNVDMDLEPFSRINPCGFEGLEVTQMRDLGLHEDSARISSRLVNQIRQQFGYHSVSEARET